MDGNSKATIVAVMILLLIPIPIKSKEERDNSVEYRALVYKVTDVQRERKGYAESIYEKGIIIEVFGQEIYNNVR